MLPRPPNCCSTWQFEPTDWQPRSVHKIFPPDRPEPEEPDEPAVLLVPVACLCGWLRSRTTGRLSSGRCRSWVLVSLGSGRRSHSPSAPIAYPGLHAIATQRSPSTRKPRPHTSGQTRLVLPRTASTASSVAILTSSAVPACLLNASSARREPGPQWPSGAPDPQPTRLSSSCSSRAILAESAGGAVIAEDAGGVGDSAATAPGAAGSLLRSCDAAIAGGGSIFAALGCATAPDAPVSGLPGSALTLASFWRCDRAKSAT